MLFSLRRFVALSKIVQADYQPLSPQDKTAHIPYRDSKLTRILQDALVSPPFIIFQIMAIVHQIRIANVVFLNRREEMLELHYSVVAPPALLMHPRVCPHFVLVLRNVIIREKVFIRVPKSGCICLLTIYNRCAK